MNSDPAFLILGGSGFVGRHLFATLGPGRALATYHAKPFHGGVYFDATRMRLKDSLLGSRHAIRTAFLLYGVTNIDACAREPESTWLVNVKSMQQVIDDLVEAGIKPIYASTDAVFDGSRGRWTEEDSPNPSLTYGKQKAEVERYLMSKRKPWIIARLSKIVGSDPGTHSLLGEWVRQIEAGQAIRCATDLIFTPAHVDDVVAALVRLSGDSLSGIFNVCGPASMSRMDLLRTLLAEIRRYRQVKARVVPCSIRDFPFLEPRPLDGSMVPDKLYGILGRPFRDMESVCAELALALFSGASNRLAVEKSQDSNLS